MKHIQYKILPLLFLFFSILSFGQTQDPRWELVQPIEAEIEIYINTNITTFQLSTEDTQSIQEAVTSGELPQEDVNAYTEVVKRDRLRGLYFQEYPENRALYLAQNSTSSSRQSQANCANGGFESSTANYSFYSRVNWNHPGGDNVNLGNTININPGFFSLFIPNPTNLNNNTNVSIVTPGNDPTLQSAGNIILSRVFNGVRAIRLNPRNDTPENATILTRQFSIDQPVLSINFAVAFNNPGHSINANPFVRFEVFDLTTNTLVDSRVITSDNSGACLRDTPINPPNSPNDSQWRYSPWSCLNLDVSQSIGNNVEFRAIISDCRFTEHDAILYLDDICNQGNECNNSLFGDLFLDPQGINCPTQSFQVCGTLNNPTCISTNPIITLQINDANSTITTLSNPIITNNTFCFTVNPSNFGTNPTGNFEFHAIADYGNSTIVEDISANPGADVSFNNCPSPCDIVTGSFINGTDLCWNDITDGDYEIQFISSSDCPNKGSSTQTFMNYTQNSNCIDLGDVLRDLNRKCFRWRIRTDCSDWSDWCLLGAGSTSIDPPFVSFGDCIPSNPCENFDATINLTSPNNDILSGTIIYDTYIDITASNIVSNGATSTYQASNSILLTTGFHANYGSAFIAKIIPCDPTITPPPSSNKQAVIEDLKVYPNPATNKLTLVTKEAKIISLELYNIYGKLINRKEKVNSNAYTIDVSRLTRGYYIIKVQLEDNTVIYRNIILK